MPKGAVAMSDAEFMYMGKNITIREEHPNAVVSVDGREFHCHYHEGEDGVGLAMWVCDEAYFASPDLHELARHFADYGYMFDAPGRVAVNDAGEVIDHTTSRAAGAPAPLKKSPSGKPGRKPTKKSSGGHDQGGGR